MVELDLTERPPGPERGVVLVVARHGRTRWTLQRRWCGWSDPPLDEVGRRQAEALGGQWSELLAAPPDGFWCSDLRRARETAALAVGRADPHGRWPACRADPRLRELDFGELDGLTWDELPGSSQEALLRPGSFAAPGGESVGELGARLDAWLAELTPGWHVVVTHGGPLRHLVALDRSDPEEHFEPGSLRVVRLAAPTGGRGDGRVVPPAHPGSVS